MEGNVCPFKLFLKTTAVAHSMRDNEGWRPEVRMNAWCCLLPRCASGSGLAGIMTQHGPGPWLSSALCGMPQSPWQWRAQRWTVLGFNSRESPMSALTVWTVNLGSRGGWSNNILKKCFATATPGFQRVSDWVSGYESQSVCVGMTKIMCRGHSYCQEPNIYYSMLCFLKSNNFFFLSKKGSFFTKAVPMFHFDTNCQWHAECRHKYFKQESLRCIFNCLTVRSRTFCCLSGRQVLFFMQIECCFVFCSLPMIW